MGKVLMSIALISFIIVGGIVILNQNQNQTKSLNTPFSLPTPTSDPLLTLPSNVQNQAASSPNQPTQQPTQTQAQPQSETLGPQAATVSAVIKTTKGDILVSLYSKEAPNTVLNFIQKTKSGYYNNLIFHRVEDWVVQGGDPKGNGTGGGQMLTEINALPFTAGSLGVARGSDIRISNDSQFFITKTDATWLNGQYDNFGMVEKGMDIVSKIEIGDKILGITLR